MSPNPSQQVIVRDIHFTRWLFRAYLVLLFLLPLPLGSNRPIFWSLMVAAIAVIALTWSIGWFAGIARWPGAIKRAKWVLVALAIFVLWGGVQVVVESPRDAPPTGVISIEEHRGGGAAPTEELSPRDAPPTGVISIKEHRGGGAAPTVGQSPRDAPPTAELAAPTEGLSPQDAAPAETMPMVAAPAEGLSPRGAAPTGVGTVDWQASMDALLLSVGLFLLAALTIILVRSGRRALLVLYTLVLAGLLQAILGSMLTLSGAEFTFLDYRQVGGGNAHGTFINRNHYANLLVLALSAGVGLLLAQMNLKGSSNNRQRLRSLLQAALGPKARLRIYMVVMVIALVLTRSRMGNTAFFAALTIVGLFALWRLRKPSRPLLVLVVSVLVIDIFVVGTWFGVEQVIDRVQQTVQGDGWQVNEKIRLDTSRESMDMIRQSPVTGFGGGSFYTAYPAWRGDDQGFMDHAHNDYLEFVVEYGLVGGLLLAWFLLLCLMRAATGLRDRDRARRFGISFASLMAMVAMMIHATVDFSLHIPANAAWFVVLCVLPYTLNRANFPNRINNL